MDDQVLWFEWNRDEPVSPPQLTRAVHDGGMGLANMVLIGQWEFGDGWVRLKGGMSPKLEYYGPAREDGPYSIEVIGYERNATPVAFKVGPWRMPERYQD